MIKEIEMLKAASIVKLNKSYTNLDIIVSTCAAYFKSDIMMDRENGIFVCTYDNARINMGIPSPGTATALVVIDDTPVAELKVDVSGKWTETYTDFDDIDMKNVIVAFFNTCQLNFKNANITDNIESDEDTMGEDIDETTFASDGTVVEQVEEPDVQ